MGTEQSEEAHLTGYVIFQLRGPASEVHTLATRANEVMNRNPHYLLCGACEGTGVQPPLGVVKVISTFPTFNGGEDATEEEWTDILHVLQETRRKDEERRSGS